MNQLLESHLGPRSDAGFKRKDHKFLPPSYSFPLQAFPAFYIGREDLESGNKVLLPPNILDRLSNYQLPEPLIFSIQNTTLGISTNIGVLEFISEKDTIILPNWLFMQLNLDIATEIHLQPLLKVPKGEYMKLQPYETEFMKLSNPKAILENNLTNYVCVTQGDVLNVQIMNRFFQFNILDVKPKLQSNCICLIDTDVEVEFAKPLDYVDKSTKVYEVVDEIYPVKEESKEEKLFYRKGIQISGQVVFESHESQKSTNFDWEYDSRKHRLTHGIKSTPDEQTKDKKFINNRGPIIGRIGPKKIP